MRNSTYAVIAAHGDRLAVDEEQSCEEVRERFPSLTWDDLYDLRTGDLLRVDLATALVCTHRHEWPED